ncbi:MAG: hypothetical protein A2X35_00060 [Elusimicrobia bacterium GWA2_61_42]|nr:MAG: hypothetical protein A2X35_00060 [Elusimicrobia bacterium GWA2_61_42]OGR78087.1 MAG: hypothetical protein A2X38_06765 [Elusimicrobia bacterium GWC2_61_25]
MTRFANGKSGDKKREEQLFSPGAKTMKLAFIITSPATLKHDWYRDPLYQKVGVPNLAGFLKRAGFPEITQYDFNNQVLKVYKESPGLVKLISYSDRENVRRFLERGDSALEKQTAFLLDTLGIERQDFFGISINHFLGDEGEIALGINLAQCLAKALKQRFPGCVIALGGLQNMSLPFQREAYSRILEECPAFDYAVCGEAHLAMLYICRALEKKKTFASAAPGNFRTVQVGKSLLINEIKGEARAEVTGHYFEPLPPGETRNKSVPFGLPAYDKANSRAYAYTGEELRKFYHLPAGCAKLLAPADKDTFLLLQASFNEGCPFGCYFCAGANTKFFSLGIKESVRMLKRMKEELGCRHFLFYDPNFNPTPGYAKRFLAEIIKAKLDIRWSDCFNLRSLDREMAAMMREAGVIKIIAGVEYPTRRMLKYINKGLSVETIYRNLEELHKAGIWNHVLLITGLPTETETDVAEMEDWIRATKDMVNSYTVGSFHMALGSPFQKQPEKFGFKLGQPLSLYCQDSYDEQNGPGWEEKSRLNLDSNRRIVQLINALKGTPKYTGARMDDSHLLMYLYRTLGHKNKKLIEKLYEAAFTVNPHAERAREGLRLGLEAPGSALRALLARTGLKMELGPAGRETVEFNLKKGGASLRCALQARSENVLLNPAPGRVHGGHFMLESGASSGPARALSAIKKHLGAVLTAAEAWDQKP